MRGQLWIAANICCADVNFCSNRSVDRFVARVPRALRYFACHFTLKPKQLARTEPLTALNRIQVQMGALNKEAGGYVLLNFSQLLDDELQMVMVGQNDLARVLELGAELGIKVEPALEALKVAVHV